MKMLLAIVPFMMGVCFSQVIREVQVMGDRVNLRLKPDYSGTVLAQANFHDRLIVVEMGEKWVQVKPTADVACWIHSEYLHKNIVKPKKLRVRSGPSANHQILMELERGDVVEQVSTNGLWMQIKTLDAIPVYISRDYVEIVNTAPAAQTQDLSNIPIAKTEPIPASNQTAAAANPQPPPGVMRSGAGAPPALTVPDPLPPVASAPPEKERVEFKPVAPEIMIRDREAEPKLEPMPPPAGIILVPLPGQGRESTRKGRLRIARFKGRSPSKFRLMVPKGNGETLLCFVCPADEEALKAQAGEWLAIQGSEYWVQGTDIPVLVPRNIYKKKSTTD